MATKSFRSTVLEPTSEFAYGDKLRFTALATVGEVLKGSFSEATIGEDGIYSIDLQYGKHRIDYKPYEGVWRHFADVEVSADTLATTLQDLALSSVPVTDETILVLQGILADAETAKTESAAIRDEAAASAAAAASSEDNVLNVIDNSSFFKRYAFSLTEDAVTSGATGNYTVVKLDKMDSLSFEYPVYSISGRGVDVVFQAMLIPLVGELGYTGGNVLYKGYGSVDFRVFFEIVSGRPAMYVATRNTIYNNASITLHVSTSKKLTPELIHGAQNIDSWLASNPAIFEATKIDMGA